MPLVHCRACNHEVDTSALACPQCGATNPGHKLSRQQWNFIVSLIQGIIVITLLGWGGWHVWNTTVPMIKEVLGRSQAEQAQEQANQH
jgi:hypothetical protein